jgi:NodT family efflux transporter outer membrane factor (OMF) lipoprotein
LARVREARARRGIAAADQLPVIDARAGFERHGDSANVPFADVLPLANEYSAGFDASWELDLWGRVRRDVEAADADLAATEEEARDVALLLAAETARTYVELRSFQQRAAIARRHVGLQEETLALARARNDAGLVGGRDVAQAATLVELTRSRVPPLDLGVRVAEHRLAVLLGLAPGALAAELSEARPVPAVPATIAVGVPADLLRRRADVRRAERELAAATARIGVAQGDLFPRLTLNGSLGLAAEDAADLLQYDSRRFAFGPSLRWNLFDSGRIRQQVAVQDARAEQALVAWERAVLEAVEESERSMASLAREQERHQSLANASGEASRAVELARTDYESGLSDFQAVLDSERTRADVEDALAESDAAAATHAIALFKAIGGGVEQEGRDPAGA